VLAAGQRGLTLGYRIELLLQGFFALEQCLVDAAVDVCARFR
jgi:hypothetical protein